MSFVFVPFHRPAASKYRSWYRRTSPPSCVTSIVKFLLFPILLSMLLSACATEGDFGRPRPTIFDRFSDEWLASDTTLLGSRGGSGVTDDEFAMRESGHRLAAPLSLMPPGYSGAPGDIHAEGLLAAIHRELGTDHQVLTDFGQAARRVMMTDSRRMQAVYDHDPYVLVEDRQSARVRIQENFAFIESVFAGFHRRIQGYDYAIDEVQVRSPGSIVIEVKGSLQHLRDRAASIEYELTNQFGIGAAKDAYGPARYASRGCPGPQTLHRPHPGHGECGHTPPGRRAAPPYK